MKTKGFTLIEVLIAIGVMTIALFAFLEIQSNLYHSVADIETKLERLNLERDVGNILASRNSCRKSLGGQIVPTTIPTNYVSPNLNSLTMVSDYPPIQTVFEVKSNFNYTNKLHVGSIKLKNIVNISAGANNLYTSDVMLQLQWDERLLKPIEIKNVFLEVDAANRKITSCSLVANLAITQCTFEGTWFYYDAKDSNDFAITCRDGRITGWCGNTDPDTGDAPWGFKPNVYICEGNSLVKVFK